MHTTLKRVALAALLFAPLMAERAVAQTPNYGDPTRAGTQIVNTASVTFTDANSNTYDAVTAQATVTVSRIYGVETDNPVGDLTPSLTPGTGYDGSFYFNFRNTGNQYDSLTVAPGTVPAGVTISGYALQNADGSTTVQAQTTNLALIHAAIAAYNSGRGLDYVGNSGIAANGWTTDESQMRLVVFYHVDPDRGGVPLEIPVEICSADGTTCADEEYGFTPELEEGVTVTANPTANTVLRNETDQQTVVFTITNAGNGPDSFGWTVNGSAGLTIVSINGGASNTGNTGASPLDAAGTFPVTVIYTINNAVTAQQTITLTATSVADNTVTDDATHTVSVSQADVDVTKEAFTDQSGTTALTTAAPDTDVWYRITVTNPAANAVPVQGVSLTDALPIALLFQEVVPDVTVGANSATGWTVTTPAVGTNGTVNASLPASYILAPGASRVIWIRASIR